MKWVLIGFGVGVVAALAGALHIFIAMTWVRRLTLYDAYFKRPVAERRALKAAVARRARSVLPLLRPVPAGLPASLCPYSESARYVYIIRRSDAGAWRSATPTHPPPVPFPR